MGHTLLCLFPSIRGFSVSSIEKVVVGEKKKKKKKKRQKKKTKKTRNVVPFKWNQSYGSCFCSSSDVAISLYKVS